MDLILLEPGDGELVFGKAPDGESKSGGIDAIWRDAATLRGIGRCFELVSLHQGMKQQVTTDVSNSARTSGRPVITEFTCVKYVDATSVKLYDLCLRAKPLGSGPDQPTRLYITRQTGDKTANLITIALHDALISEIQLQTHPDDMPTEQFKLNFTEILWTYSVQQADGQPGDQQTTGWSLARNRPIRAFTG
ncbi:type VI secretion system tube protein Hcp [Janthinobacterium sp. SUN120]|uniref:Hcp family type VI secretion system effector n=1 Tax=Janthinobacterium sp. SUN120 TaxID=3004099 RepID=UPI0025AFA7C2|nr:type VI secretion system tube protein Hcp [Janthinobacterium sp. SUN120]MDN2714527.1 type VI secretion system tube protein Hcp [Janthinobacterium sp. SUN120]